MRAGQVIEGAKDEGDAIRKLGQNKNSFKAPVVSDSPQLAKGDLIEWN